MKPVNKDEKQESIGLGEIARNNNKNVMLEKEEIEITSEAEEKVKLHINIGVVHGQSEEEEEEDVVDKIKPSQDQCNQDDNEGKDDEPNFRQDLASILLLFFLYVLQGIPLGLLSTIPLILQSRKVPYTEQAKFSLVGWPFSLKILYAPIVDAIYFKRFGRRKSWLIPLQYLIAMFLFILSFQIDSLLDSVNIEAITAVFFILCFLAATQDVTVDGWAISMLHPKNVGYASSCNAVGQTLGSIISYSGFLALNSAEFANKYFRSTSSHSDIGLVSLPQFLFFWAVVFALTTTLILLFKKEGKESEEVSEQHGDILASYRNLWKILKLRNMQILIVFFFTVRIGYAASEAMTRLKLVEKGVPKERVAFYSIPLIPVKLLIPFVLSKYIAGPKPMSVFIRALPFNLLFGLVMPIVVFWTPAFREQDDNNEYYFPMTFYVLLFFIFAIQLIPSYAMFVSSMAFAAKISDPAIGGTYMTLVNTCNNVGSMWVHTGALWLVDYVAIPLGNTCLGGIWDILLKDSKATTAMGKYGDTRNSSIDQVVLLSNSNTNNSYYAYSTVLPETTMTTMDAEEELFGSPTAATQSRVQPVSPSCSNVIDGFYVESVICFCIGLVWLLVWGKRTIQKLQRKPISSWRIFN